MKRLALLLTMLFVPLLAGEAAAQQWVASWTGSAHGPYPVGNPTAQPELKYAFPSADQGARNQTFRLIVRPDAWASQTRVRLSNVFGTKPVTFNDAFVGLQESGAAIMKGTGTVAGVPDLCFVKNGHAYFLELKSPSAPLSRAQEAVLIRLRECGAIATHAHGLDQALACLERWGLLRGHVAS